MNLLSHFALFQTQLVKIHAELHQSIGPDDVINANVEMKLTPAALARKPDPVVEAQRTAYQVGVRLYCRGLRKAAEADADPKPAFTLECVLNASYQQLQGEPIDFDTFSQHHMSLTRQLYPLIRQQLLPLFSQLGIASVRLPQEIIQAAGDAPPQQLH
ncbi:MAG: hypothetical protein AAF552_11870 [Pseudomonadota bacterium]